MYNVELGARDNAGNWGYNTISIRTATSINYGTNIQNDYPNLYISSNPRVPLANMGAEIANYDDFYNGNYKFPRSLQDQIEKIGTISTLVSMNNTIGQHTFNFRRVSRTNNWIKIRHHLGYFTGSTSVSNINLIFSDNSTYTLQEAVNNHYIEPLVIVSSSSPSTTHLFLNVMNVISGGSTNTASYPMLYTFFKVKDIPISAISSNTSDCYTGGNDGTEVIELDPSVDISTTPF